MPTASVRQPSSNGRFRCIAAASRASALVCSRVLTVPSCFVLTLQITHSLGEKASTHLSMCAVLSALGNHADALIHAQAAMAILQVVQYCAAPLSTQRSLRADLTRSTRLEWDRRPSTAFRHCRLTDSRQYNAGLTDGVPLAITLWPHAHDAPYNPLHARQCCAQPGAP